MSLAFYKVTALPETLVANGIYFVTSATGTLMDVYVANSDGTASRKTLGEAEMAAAIAAYDATGAARLAEAFDLTLDGDIGGTATIDGSGDVTLTAILPAITDAGEAPVVTFNSKGLITGARSLEASDFPEVLDSNITGNAATATVAETAGAVTGVLTINSERYDGSEALDLNLISAAEKGVAGGVATLDENGQLTASQLPLTIDEVIEYDTREEFPETGLKSKIYVAAIANVMYRWTGTDYIIIPGGTSLAETALALQVPREIALEGDATGAIDFDGSEDVSIAVTLANVGTAGAQGGIVTTDAKGRVVSSRALELSDLPVGITSTGVELAAPAAW